MGKEYLKRFGQALRLARLNREWSQEELAHRSNLDRTYISMLERGIRNPTLGSLKDLAQALEIELTYLVQDKLATLKERPRGKLLPSSHSKGIKLPLYGTAVSCGQPLTADDTIEKEFSLDENLIKHPEITFFVRASGDSMAPTILEGDLLVIEQTNRPKNGDVVLARLDGEFSVKRFSKSDAYSELCADNPFYANLKMSSLSEVILCGVVKAIIRSSV